MNLAPNQVSRVFANGLEDQDYTLGRVPETVIFWGIFSIEEYVMTSHFFSQGLSVNAIVYTEVLPESYEGQDRQSIQQASPPSDKFRTIQARKRVNLNGDVLLLTNLSELKPLNYYV